MYSRIWQHFSLLCCTILVLQLISLACSTLHRLLFLFILISHLATMAGRGMACILRSPFVGLPSYFRIWTFGRLYRQLFYRNIFLRFQLYTTGRLFLKIQSSLRPPIPKNPSRPIATVASRRYPWPAIARKTSENRGGRSCCLTD